ncbi:MAG TPA: NAD(P)H-hydrate epimerase [Candidatus Hydrogenedentes bacterium]|nr:NAD(P)H-hydrate epimerase [Candidatus Hydrogenedentota bacterium]
MKMLSAAQMREADRRCIEDLGMPGVVLMNNAGQAVFEHIRGGPVGVVCGKGNNGGDGFVVARLALLAGYEPRVVLVATPEDIRGDAAVFMQLYRNLGGAIEVAPDAQTATEAVRRCADCAVLVDALLGTGISGEVRGPIRAAIEAWPEGVHTIAVDLPSGMNADTGEPCGACIRANVTVTFAFAKQGFANPDAISRLGALHVADIGIPEVCGDDVAWARLASCLQPKHVNNS